MSLCLNLSLPPLSLSLSLSLPPHYVVGYFLWFTCCMNLWLFSLSFWVIITLIMLHVSLWCVSAFWYGGAAFLCNTGKQWGCDVHDMVKSNIKSLKHYVLLQNTTWQAGTVYTTNINLNNIIIYLCDGLLTCPEESYQEHACHWAWSGAIIISTPTMSR